MSEDGRLQIGEGGDWEFSRNGEPHYIGPAFKKPPGLYHALNWHEPPPVERENFVRLVCARPGEKRQLLTLSRQLIGFKVHYYRDRTIPCVKRIADCPACEAQRRRSWKGYVGCYDYNGKEFCIAEITHNAVLSCAALRKPSAELRGKILTLIRTGDAKNSPVRADLQDRPPSMQYVPEDFDVKKALCSIWGWPLTLEEVEAPQQ